jgi:hypothetical protein
VSPDDLACTVVQFVMKKPGQPEVVVYTPS